MFCKYYNTDPDGLVRLKVDEIKNMVVEYIVQLKRVAKKYVSKAKRGEICDSSNIPLCFQVYQFILISLHDLRDYYPVGKLKENLAPLPSGLFSPQILPP